MGPILSNLRAFPGAEKRIGPGAAGAGRRVAQILRAGYICDIIRDAETQPPIFHWVVQNVETNEILGLGQARTLAEGELTARLFLDDLRMRRAI